MSLQVSDGMDEVVPPRSQYGLPAINELFAHWERTMGYPITVKTTENRRFAAILLKRETPARIKEYITLAWFARSDRYAPRVTSLTDLYYKWDKLTDWAMRKRDQQGEVINLE